MSQSGDAAEQIVRMSLEGVQVAARVSGEGAKEIAALIYTIMKNKEQTAGKTTLSKMLKSGKELKVFSLKNEDFKKFTEEAKRYGILYCALINKKDKINDGIIDIMVRVDDSQKINRIVKRYKLSEYKEADIRTEIEKTRKEKILKQQENKENPSLAKMENESLSSPFLENKKSLLEGSNIKESVRKIIQKIKDNNVKKELPDMLKEELEKGKEVVMIDTDKRKTITYKKTDNGIVKTTVKNSKTKTNVRER